MKEYKSRLFGNVVTIHATPEEDYIDLEQCKFVLEGVEVDYYAMMTPDERNKLEDELNATYQVELMAEEDAMEPFWNDNYHYMGGQ